VEYIAGNIADVLLTTNPAGNGLYHEGVVLRKRRVEMEPAAILKTEHIAFWKRMYSKPVLWDQSRIISLESEPEVQRDAAPATTAVLPRVPDI
jgi:hypothetical protein